MDIDFRKAWHLCFFRFAPWRLFFEIFFLTWSVVESVRSFHVVFVPLSIVFSQALFGQISGICVASASVLHIMLGFDARCAVQSKRRHETHMMIAVAQNVEWNKRHLDPLVSVLVVEGSETDLCQRHVFMWRSSWSHSGYRVCLRHLENVNFRRRVTNGNEGYREARNHHDKC